jgi:hypothetical protein
VRILWPNLQSIDINGSPKILPCNIIRAMNLKSYNWFLDPELMVKAHYMGARVLEFNVFARMRSNGLSHVHVSTVWEFFRNLIRFRFSKELAEWKKRDFHKSLKVENETAHTTV